MLDRTASLAPFLALVLLFCPDPLARPAEQGSTAPAASAVPGNALAEMSWLAGDWSGDAWGGRFHAHYTSPAGGRILGYSRLVKGGQDTYYEFEVFELRAERVHLQPFPGGKRADGFELAAHDAAARRAVFENPAKDWPTRIVYQRVEPDRLVITLSDPHGTSDKVETFDLRADAP